MLNNYQVKSRKIFNSNIIKKGYFIEKSNMKHPYLKKSNRKTTSTTKIDALNPNFRPLIDESLWKIELLLNPQLYHF